MKTNQKSFYYFILILFLSPLFLSAQNSEVEVVTDQKRYIYVEEEIPVFQIKAEPNSLIDIQITNNPNLFQDEESRNDSNFFSSYWGRDDVEMKEIKADDMGKATYKLPDGPLLGLTVTNRKLYYRALVVESDQDFYSIKGYSLKDENWKEAPYIEVFSNKDDADAWDHYWKGVKLYKEGKIDEAIDEFDKADQLYSHPDYIYNIGQCYLQITIEYFEYYKDNEYVASFEKEEAQKIVESLKKLKTSLKERK